MRITVSITHRQSFVLTLLSIWLVGSALGASAAPAVPPWRIGIPWSTNTAKVTIGGETIDAQIADTGELRSRGLGYRDGLKPGTGMLFVYQSASIRSFWMKGMRFCLDIIWIEQSEIKGAAESVCPIEGANDGDLPSYKSPEPVTYVLEMPAGWMQEHGFSAGEPVTIEMP